MEKRLTTSAMLFSVGFVFMLVCAVGAFFYGVKIGSEKMELKYNAAAKQDGEASKHANSPYQQQDLVSFYLTVYSPYREFQNEWFAAMTKLSKGQAVDISSTFKELAKLADKKSKDASSFDMQKSPLLGEAQVGYIRSLKKFKEAAAKAAGTSSKVNVIELYKSILNEKNYTLAAEESLNAQRAYFHAIQKWTATIDPDIPSEYKASAGLSTTQWKQLPIAIKNTIIVDYLVTRKELNTYYPHDMTSRIDEFIESGQAAKMKLTTLTGIIDLLMNTEAVDLGDFSLNKGRFYQSEVLPQLPFFYPETN
ncbi:hypothetical protein [Paenibacillus sp. L3-i20]|uniref:hypothetical protein n=1 Tax=Paenibacillus sp. L3-i20 TaxID=2905833 RepID=UPI001EDD0359|nr:hypothetical protein [Paenibacillus sp. L3-i20]GKU79576.1 hypothetical protein L3i20_v239730 [Paenibacillus sp. L3-i20]